MTRIIQGDFRLGVTVPGARGAEPLVYRHPEGLVDFGPVLTTSARYSGHHHWSAGDIDVTVSRHNELIISSNREACYGMVQLAIDNIMFSEQSIISGVKLISNTLGDHIRPTITANSKSISIAFAARGKFHLGRGRAKFRIYTLTECAAGVNGGAGVSNSVVAGVTAQPFRDRDSERQFFLLSGGI